MALVLFDNKNAVSMLEEITLTGIFFLWLDNTDLDCHGYIKYY